MNTDRLKCRVWDNANSEKKYMFPKHVRLDGNGTLYVWINHTSGWAWYDTDIYFSKRFTVEQCSGLKDKNGKLIYEGDIIKDKWNVVGLIIRREATFYVRNWSHEGEINDYPAGMNLENVGKIIGNINENPKLFK